MDESQSFMNWITFPALQKCRKSAGLIRETAVETLGEGEEPQSTWL
jgi:hypothetical protein